MFGGGSHFLRDGCSLNVDGGVSLARLRACVVRYPSRPHMVQKIARGAG